MLRPPPPISFSTIGPATSVGSGRFIVSVGPREVVAFPRAEVLLNDVKDRLAAAEPNPDDLLMAAELELTLGGGPAAKSYLAQIPATGLPEKSLERKARFLRAVLYQELAAHPEDASTILGELDTLRTRRLSAANSSRPSWPPTFAVAI